ncbi:hypothetical protein BD309DRAFT_851287 [Dichomitus squalens]|nr:hypothetical protein BD309DRAFT_851287 [Dichomitus squalens]
MDKWSSPYVAMMDKHGAMAPEVFLHRASILQVVTGAVIPMMQPVANSSHRIAPSSGIEVEKASMPIG